jgi:hypothetical protein
LPGRLDADQRVPVLRHRDRGRIDVLASQQLAEVFEG